MSIIFRKMSYPSISIPGTPLQSELLVALSEIHRFAKDCLLAVGTSENIAEALAACLTEADYKGHYYEGLYQLSYYISVIEAGGCDKTAVPSIIKETPVTAWVDGNNGLGVVVANFCMDLAISKAKTSGIGWVVARGSNHVGMMGTYPVRALKEGVIGVGFTNGSPLVAPYGAIHSALGTNPISVAAPALNGDSFILDISTAEVPVGKVEMLGSRRLSIPEEWANKETGALRPMGGFDAKANYKGTGLAFAVEIFCGILSGSGYGPNIRKYGNNHEAANFGQCFIAVNPNYFAPGFDERLSDLMGTIRNMEPAESHKSVQIPGDTERQHMVEVDEQGGVLFHPDLIYRLGSLAKRLEVTALNSKQ